MKKHRIFYGWRVVLTAAMALFWGIPVTVYSFSVFLKPLIRDFHATRSAVSFAFTLRAIVDALAAECGTVELARTAQNTYIVSSTLQVPKRVKFIGACGAFPFEGSEVTVGTTLKRIVPKAKPGQPEPDIVTDLPKVVVSFHDAPGATMSGISIDCNNLAADHRHSLRFRQ